MRIIHSIACISLFCISFLLTANPVTAMPKYSHNHTFTNFETVILRRKLQDGSITHYPGIVDKEIVPFLYKVYFLENEEAVPEYFLAEQLGKLY